MTTASLTAPVRHIPVPDLSRERRRAELDRLATDEITAFALSATTMTVLLRAYAHPGLPADELIRRWHSVVAEQRRYLGVASGDWEWAGTDPLVAEADLRAALDDLLDGTDTYHGKRS